MVQNSKLFDQKTILRSCEIYLIYAMVHGKADELITIKQEFAIILCQKVSNLYILMTYSFYLQINSICFTKIEHDLNFHPNNRIWSNKNQQMGDIVCLYLIKCSSSMTDRSKTVAISPTIGRSVSSLYTYMHILCGILWFVRLSYYPQFTKLAVKKMFQKSKTRSANYYWFLSVDKTINLRADETSW